MSIDKDYKISEIEEADSDWIAHHLHKLRLYLENKSGQKLNDVPEPKFLDQYFNIALQDLKRGDISLALALVNTSKKRQIFNG